MRVTPTADPRLGAILPVLVAGLLTACSQAPVVYTDRAAQFAPARYATFAFLEPLPTDESGYTTLTTARLKNTVTEALVGQGWRHDESDPDVLVSFEFRVRDVQRVVDYPTTLGAWRYHGDPWGSYAGFGYDLTSHYVRYGTLVIDIVDKASMAQVWTGRLEQHYEPEADTRPGESVVAMARAVMADLPAAGTAN